MSVVGGGAATGWLPAQPICVGVSAFGGGLLAVDREILCAVDRPHMDVAVACKVAATVGTPAVGRPCMFALAPAVVVLRTCRRS